MTPDILALALALPVALVACYRQWLPRKVWRPCCSNPECHAAGYDWRWRR